MSEHQTHASHSHQHGPNCGHTGIRHGDHVDYLHDGHLHRDHAGHVDECRVETTGANAATCTPKHACSGHEVNHAHRPGCGHEAVPHGDHTDFLVEGHLHHPHGSHCDDHGAVSRV